MRRSLPRGSWHRPGTTHKKSVRRPMYEDFVEAVVGLYYCAAAVEEIDTRSRRRGRLHAGFVRRCGPSTIRREPTIAHGERNTTTHPQVRGAPPGIIRRVISHAVDNAAIATSSSTMRGQSQGRHRKFFHSRHIKGGATKATVLTSFNTWRCPQATWLKSRASSERYAPCWPSTACRMRHSKVARVDGVAKYAHGEYVFEQETAATLYLITG